MRKFILLLVLTGSFTRLIASSWPSQNLYEQTMIYKPFSYGTIPNISDRAAKEDQDSNHARLYSLIDNLRQILPGINELSDKEERMKQKQELLNHCKIFFTSFDDIDETKDKKDISVQLKQKSKSSIFCCCIAAIFKERYLNLQLQECFEELNRRRDKIKANKENSILKERLRDQNRYLYAVYFRLQRNSNDWRNKI